MMRVWILLCPFLLASAGAFMIHNTRRSLCLEESAGVVLFRPCNLDSGSQQWVWIDQSMLMSVASSRCLSALQVEPPKTWPCSGGQVDPAGLLWDCDRDRLISRNSSMLLSVDGQRLILTHDGKQAKWRSVDGGDICQERLRSRRASDEPEEFEETVGKKDKQAAMTEEQREYLRWFYRTEDPTIWKFVLLGLAFICLLIGFMLLGMGAMANKDGSNGKQVRATIKPSSCSRGTSPHLESRNRKKIAKYKAAAALAHSEGEQLRVITVLSDECNKPSASPHRAPLAHTPLSPNGELSELKAGNIVVTWKDGNTSCLYPDPAAEEEEEHQEECEEVHQEEKPEEKQEEKQEEQLDHVEEQGERMEEQVE